MERGMRELGEREGEGGMERGMREWGGGENGGNNASQKLMQIAAIVINNFHSVISSLLETH